MKIKNVNLNMQGKAVRVEGVVQNIKGKFMGRPKYQIFDGSGALIVFRSMPLEEKIEVGDNIEVNAQAGVIEYEVLKIDRIA